jgi:integrase/recombinase XerD
VASDVGVLTINQAVSTLRFFFRVSLKRHEIVEHIKVIHEARKLPVVLSLEEVARLLDTAPGLKHRAALSVVAPLRATEVVSLNVADIDSKRVIIRVGRGSNASSVFADRSAERPWCNGTIISANLGPVS